MLADPRGGMRLLASSEERVRDPLVLILVVIQIALCVLAIQAVSPAAHKSLGHATVATAGPTDLIALGVAAALRCRGDKLYL